MADEQVVDQTVTPADQSQTTGEQEHQPGTEVASATGAEQTSTQQSGEAGSQSSEQAKADKKRTPWYQHRINELTRERKEAQEARDRETAELRRKLEELQRGQTDTSTQQTKPASQSVDLEKAKAEWMREKSFNDACTAIYNAGAKEFKDFDETLKQIGMVGEVPQHFYEAVTEIPDGHKVLYHVGQNPDLARELISLSPVKLAIRMADIKAQVDRPQTKPVSQTPAPIKPINGAGAGDVDLSKASLDDFMERRNREAPVKR